MDYIVIYFIDFFPHPHPYPQCIYSVILKID